MKLLIMLAVAIVLLAAGQDVHAAKAGRLERNGVTFHFDKLYEVGQFVTGDLWVHNYGEPVIVTRITPDSAVVNGRTINGAQIDPKNINAQGYDSAARDMPYDATLNVDPAATGNSLRLMRGASLIKGVSTQEDLGRPILTKAEILTVLSGSPPKGSFRPPYSGPDKAVVATLDDVDRSKLGQYPILPSTPHISDYAQSMARPWIEQSTEWTARDIHPSQHMPAYGRDLAKLSGEIAVLLQLNFTAQEKEPALINMVQYGIDILGVIREGGKLWYSNGGHNLGRKTPLLIAGVVLDNAEMLEYADASKHLIFQDDQQHFYVSKREVDYSRSGGYDSLKERYSVSDVGLAEWAINFPRRPESIDSSWSAPYRKVCGGAQVPHVLAAHLMGLKQFWNWPPLFDYIDRYFEIEAKNAAKSLGGNAIHSPIVDIWRAYRDQSPPKPPLLNVIAAKVER